MDDILAAINKYEKAFNHFVDLREERTLTDGKMVAAARVEEEVAAEEAKAVEVKAAGEAETPTEAEPK